MESVDGGLREVTCTQVSTIHPDVLSISTKDAVKKALVDLLRTENVTSDKALAGKTVYDNLIPNMKQWKTDIVSVDCHSNLIEEELLKLNELQQWSDEFYETVSDYSTISITDAQCKGKLVTDGTSFIEVQVVSSMEDPEGIRHMQIIKSRHDMKMADKIENVTVQHTTPRYRTVRKSRSRFLGIIVDRWDKTVFSHNEVVNETKQVVKPQTFTGQDFENVKSYALRQLTAGIE